MAKLISIYWRDIPAQIVGRAAGTTIKKIMPPRFAKAIDRAAMRAGRGSSDAYLADWRRESIIVSGDLENIVMQQLALLESRFDDEFLESVIKAGGLIDNIKAKTNKVIQT